MALDPTVSPVLRAQRFELVDEAGVVRAVLATSSLTGHDDDSGAVAGLELFGGPGVAVSLLATRAGSQLSFELGGNQVLIVDAFRGGGLRDGGSTVTICDRDGVPRACWHVDDDGLITIQGDDVTGPRSL